MTVVETMVAAVILTSGVLGVLLMVQTADGVNKANRGREAATSLSRELLETARATNYATIGDVDWFKPALQGISGGSGNVANGVNGATTTVTRRGHTYTVTVNACSVDDPKDGLKTGVGLYKWCADSLTLGSGDTQAEDLKRVGVTTQWTQGQETYSLYHTATFSAAGSLIGPGLTDFRITTPSGLDATAPVITSNPTGGNVIFAATSVGAANMKFTIDGVTQVAGISTAGNGTWNLTWNILNLKDGVYTIGATAMDALGTEGDPQYIQVKLARGAPTAAANITGSYNDVYSGGTKTRVVELGWDASPDGSVTGYEVYKGTTLVCAASMLTECMDMSPASSGSTTYTVRTLYTDAGGVTSYVSSTYAVTAPAASPGNTANIWATTGTTTANATGNKCFNPASLSTGGEKRDAVTSYSPGTETTFSNTPNKGMLAACLPRFGGTTNASMTASPTGMTFSGYFRNTMTGTVACRLGIQVYKNGSITQIMAGTGINTAPATVSIPPNTTVITQFTFQLGTSAQTFLPTDQLTFIVGGFQNNTTTNRCLNTTLYYNSAARPLTASLPISGWSGGSGGGPGSITRPAAPTSLTGTANGDGTTTLTWSRSSGSPSAEFYRIYRDGQDYTNRVDTAGEPTTGSTVSWTDKDTGGTTHVYRVTAASAVLAESDFLGPITR
jgi:Tfp pilus assembly protein PilV